MVLTDLEVLVALYNATGGARWHRKENWNTDAALSRWKGVNVNRQGRVVEVILHANNLTGPIPKELGALSALRQLSLHSNQLSGSIPPELGKLVALKGLYLWANQLTGHIPRQLGDLGALEILDLSNNKLEGEIPALLGQLRNLQRLLLHRNKLTGSIPPELGNLKELKRLWLHNNELTGFIPPELGELAALHFLDLSENQLTGSIPPKLGELAALQYLLLSDNQLTGSVPAQLLKLDYLEVLAMEDNKFSGPVPSVEQLRYLRRALASSGDQHQGPEQTGRVKIAPHDDTVANKIEDASSVQSGMTTTTAGMTATTSRSGGERMKFSKIKQNDTVEGNDPDAVIGSRISDFEGDVVAWSVGDREGNDPDAVIGSRISDFEGDVVAWSFGDRAEVLRPPGFEFELDVRRLGRNVPALISLCSSSAEVIHGKQCLLHPVLTCLAGAAEEFDPPLRLRFPVGDVDSMVSGSDCGSHDDAEVAYRAHLESTFSALTREDAKSEWVPIDGAIVQIEGGVFVLELTLSHFCGFALCQNVMVDAGCVKLVPVPKLKHESRQSHYNFVNLGTQHLVVHLWGAARKRGFLEFFRVKLGLGPTSGEAEVEGRRRLVDVPSTGVKTVTVPGAPVGGRGTPVCRPVYDGVEPLTVVWTTQEQKSRLITGSTYELVQVWGDTSMTYKHALVFGPLLEGASPRISNLEVADGRFVGTRVMAEMERTGGGDG